MLRRKHGGKAQVITLGAFPRMGLGEARKKVEEYSGRAVSNVTLLKLLEEWYSEVVEKKHRQPRQVERYFSRIEPALLATKIRELDRLSVRQSLRRYAHKQSPTTANGALSILKTALRFAVDAGYIETSPIDRLSRELVGGAAKTRKRVLTDNEIRELWADETPIYAPLLKFLLLTGQRIGETKLTRREDVAGMRWCLPAENTKSNRAHWVALSAQAAELLTTLPKEGSFVFGHYTTLAVQAYVRRYCKAKGISPTFTPHDLRRTFATRLNDLGVMPHVVEKILNHSLQGVMAVYNRAEYEAERVDAMQKWAYELDRIVGSPNE